MEENIEISGFHISVNAGTDPELLKSLPCAGVAVMRWSDKPVYIYAADLLTCCWTPFPVWVGARQNKF